MKIPPLPLPGSISFPVLTLNGFATATAGRVYTIPVRGKNVFARIDGDPADVFAVVNVQLWGLVHEPDVPHSGHTWDIVGEADGTGPIATPNGVHPGVLAATVSFNIGLSAAKTAYAASVSFLEAGTAGPVLFSIPISADVLLIPPGISGVVQWNLDVFYPFPLPASEWGGVLQITANTVTAGPPGGDDTYTPVAVGTVISHTNDFTNIYVNYAIADAPAGEPLVIQVVTGPGFKYPDPPWTDGIGCQQTAGPNPVFLSDAQPGVTGVNFEIFGRILT